MAIAAPTLRPSAAIGPSRRYSFFELWHLLSLDAPTVAVLWTIFFARAAHTRLPWLVPVAMGSGVWILYALDRLLDSSRSHPAQLRERHIFHARHQRAFTAGIFLTLPTILVLSFRLTLPSVQRDMLLLSLLVAVYLLIIHGLDLSAQRSLPKELAVGLIFSAAIVIPTWARLPGSHAPLLTGCALFAALCWLNCIAIEHWEHREHLERGEHLEHRGQVDSSPCLVSSPVQLTHPTTLWAGKRLFPVSGTLALLCFIAVLLPEPLGSSLRPVAAACLLSAVIFMALSASRQTHGRGGKKLSEIALRIAADAALLTPLLFLPFL